MKPANWEALLGTRPDRELAKEWGISNHEVMMERRRRKIRALVPASENRPEEWWRQALASRTHLTSVQVANELGDVSEGAVKRWRSRIQMPSRKGPSSPPAERSLAQEIAPLTQIRDHARAITLLRLGVGEITPTEAAATLNVPERSSDFKAICRIYGSGSFEVFSV